VINARTRTGVRFLHEPNARMQRTRAAVRFLRIEDKKLSCIAREI